MTNEGVQSASNGKEKAKFKSDLNAMKKQMKKIYKLDFLTIETQGGPKGGKKSGKKKNGGKKEKRKGKKK